MKMALKVNGVVQARPEKAVPRIPVVMKDGAGKAVTWVARAKRERAEEAMRQVENGEVPSRGYVRLSDKQLKDSCFTEILASNIWWESGLINISIIFCKYELKDKENVELAIAELELRGLAKMDGACHLKLNEKGIAWLRKMEDLE